MNRVRPEDWFEVKRLSDDVTLVSERHVTPFYRCNIWHVRGGDRDLLIDSGMGAVPLRPHVPLLNDRPVIALATHTHFDHVGGHHEFDERWVHRAEAAALAEPVSGTPLTRYPVDEVFTALPPEPFDPATHLIRPAPPTRLLADGDMIDIGGRRFEVIHTPGHSPGGIALWEAGTGILFSADIVYDGPLIEGETAAEQADYLHSMKRLLALPVRVVHGGHFASYGADRHREIIETWLKAKGA